MTKTQTNIDKAKTIGKYAGISALIALGAACAVIGNKHCETLNKTEATYLGVAKNPNADLRGRSHIAYFDTDGDRTTAEIQGYVDRRNIAKLEQAQDTPMSMQDWQKHGVDKVKMIHQKTR